MDFGAQFGFWMSDFISCSVKFVTVQKPKFLLPDKNLFWVFFFPQVKYLIILKLYFSVSLLFFSWMNEEDVQSNVLIA